MTDPSHKAARWEDDTSDPDDDWPCNGPHDPLAVLVATATSDEDHEP